MTLKTTRALLMALSVAVAVVGPINAAPSSASAPATASRARRTPDEYGVMGRKVRDVVAERRVGRRLSALDPKLIQLADDTNAYLDDDGKLFFADISLAEHLPAPATSQVPTPANSTGTPVVAEGVAPATGSAFTLNSRPTSTHTIYLDFDGETVANTAWNNGRVNPKTVPPYDVDGIPGSFNAGEEQIIRNVWQTVAEDWAPFDVNVTTQRPASDDAFIRSSLSDNTFGSIAVITPDKWTCGTCGGVAYVDIHDGSAPGMYYQYAWVFPSSGWTSSTIANVVSHEVGHNFGLSHDGITGSEYYGGTGSWGPIMGNPNRTYVQWSKGEYASSTNTEDDLAVIASNAGMVADTSTSTLTAVQIGSTGLTQTTADEIIASGTDVDFHAVDVTNGYLKALFTRSLSANLYARIALLNGSGTELANAGVFSGTSATLFSGSVPNGRYYLKTEPVADTSSPGFTTYGSLGYFNWTLTRSDSPVMSSASLTPVGDRTFTASWSATSAATDGFTFTYSLCTASACGAAATSTSASAVLTAPTSTGLYFVKVTATNPYGLVSPELSSGSTNVLSRPIAPQVSKLRLDEVSDTLQVEWGNGVSFAPVTVTGHTITARNRTTGATVAVSVSGTSGATPLTLPNTWDAVWVDVSIVSNTSSASPWNSSDPSTVSLYIGRIAATSATGPNGSRAAAPPASGTSNSRVSAPGA